MTLPTHAAVQAQPTLPTLPRAIFVTGTDTGVGKTITTAVLAAALSGSGWSRVAVYKPAQTGVCPGEPGDMDEVRRLSGVDRVSEGIRLRAPMAPAAAAQREGATLPTLDQHVKHIRTLAQATDHVLVEGAGGLLVELDGEGHTLADLAARFPEDSGTVVVVRSGLGTLNHTLLTLEALRSRGLPVAGIVIGSWPSIPDDVERGNLEFLRRLNVPFLGIVPEGASLLASQNLRDQAGLWINTK